MRTQRVYRKPCRARRKAGDPKAAEVELHRPYIDAVTIKCPECGKDMHRVPEVLDCWFDSGAMPFAQHHYPFENKEVFEKQFPAKFISEAVDQTRGWFHSLMAESTLLSTRPLMRMSSCLDTYRMRTDRRCPSQRATL